MLCDLLTVIILLPEDWGNERWSGQSHLFLFSLSTPTVAFLHFFLCVSFPTFLSHLLVLLSLSPICHLSPLTLLSQLLWRGPMVERNYFYFGSSFLLLSFPLISGMGPGSSSSFHHLSSHSLWPWTLVSNLMFATWAPPMIQSHNQTKVLWHCALLYLLTTLALPLSRNWTATPGFSHRIIIDSTAAFCTSLLLAPVPFFFSQAQFCGWCNLAEIWDTCIQPEEIRSESLPLN